MHLKLYLLEAVLHDAAHARAGGVGAVAMLLGGYLLAVRHFLAQTHLDAHAAGTTSSARAYL